MSYTCGLSQPPATPSRSARTWLTGEQASETPPLRIPYMRGAIRFLGSGYATARLRSTTSSSSTSAALLPCPPTPKNLKPTRRPPRTPLVLPPPSRLLPGLPEDITHFISLLFISVLSVLALCIDVSTFCVERACLDRNQYVVNCQCHNHEKLYIYSAETLSQLCLHGSQHYLLVARRAPFIHDIVLAACWYGIILHDYPKK